jgi:hypothetical protein
MIKVLASAETARLKKNVKGAVIKSLALQNFEQEIDALYAPGGSEVNASSSSQDIREAIVSLVKMKLALGDENISHSKSSSNTVLIPVDACRCKTSFNTSCHPRGFISSFSDQNI